MYQIHIVDVYDEKDQNEKNRSEAHVGGFLCYHRGYT